MLLGLKDTDEVLKSKAITSIRDLITCKMSNALMEFLKLNFATMKECFDSVNDSVSKESLASVIAFVAIALSYDLKEESSRYECLGSTTDVQSWIDKLNDVKGDPKLEVGKMYSYEPKDWTMGSSHRSGTTAAGQILKVTRITSRLVTVVDPNNDNLPFNIPRKAADSVLSCIDVLQDNKEEKKLRLTEAARRKVVEVLIRMRAYIENPVLGTYIVKVAGVGTRYAKAVLSTICDDGSTENGYIVCSTLLANVKKNIFWLQRPSDGDRRAYAKSVYLEKNKQQLTIQSASGAEKEPTWGSGANLKLPSPHGTTLDLALPWPTENEESGAEQESTWGSGAYPKLTSPHGLKFGLAFMSY